MKSEITAENRLTPSGMRCSGLKIRTNIM